MEQTGPAPRAVIESMRGDWNRRAREDAHYYVAFGGRNQSAEEFFATARDQVDQLRRDLRRLPPLAPAARRALEIGCGPGRLMRPLSRWFGEIHGVDISDEMAARAREYLRDIPHAHVHVTPDSSLAAFAADSFDFVYSYAVFQHIPSREIVFHYLRESRRVLKTGGILCCQLNGLPEDSRPYDTWSGARIRAAEVRDFAFRHDMQLLALDGAETQYMWVTMRKREQGWSTQQRPAAARVGIRRITNASSSEPVAPVKGRFASLAIWVEKLPEDCDLNSLRVLAGGRECTVTYVGHPDLDGLQQINVHLPSGLAAGLAPIEIFRGEVRLCDRRFVRLIPAPPLVPRAVSVRDGVNLSSTSVITSGIVKVTIEEMERPENLSAAMAGIPFASFEFFCVDPRIPKHEVNFPLPPGLPPGEHVLTLRLAHRPVGVFRLTVAAP